MLAKAERPGHRVIAKNRFATLETIDDVIQRLIGVSPPTGQGRSSSPTDPGAVTEKSGSRLKTQGSPCVRYASRGDLDRFRIPYICRSSRKFRARPASGEKYLQSDQRLANLIKDTARNNASTRHSKCCSLNQRALPSLAAPGETLRESIDLIVVPAGKRQQLGNKRVQPRGVLGQQNGTAFEQIDLRNEAGLLVAVGSYIDDINALLPKRLDQAVADRGILNHERGRLPVALLYLEYLVLQLVERELSPNHSKHVIQLAAVEQHDTRRIMPSFLLAESNVPAQNDAVGRPGYDCGIVSQHFPLDNLAAGRFGRLLVLGRKKHRPHALLDIAQYFGRLMGGMQQVSVFSDMVAATAEIVSGRRLRHRGQTQDLKTGIAIQQIADEVVAMGL